LRLKRWVKVRPEVHPLAGAGRRRLGWWGETLALWWLRAKGMRLVARNWRCSLGELDLVMRDGETLVFVEVKTRTSHNAGLPEEAVGSGKRERLYRLAQAFLASQRCGQVPCRFDVVAVSFAGPLPRLRHIPAAFSGSAARNSLCQR